MRFTNAAFRRCFSDRAKGKGSLKEALGCGEEAKACGEGASCVYCAFRKNVMQAAVKDRAEKSDTVSADVRRADRTDKITVRIRILPVDGSGRLFLGLTDGTYQTELAREMLSARRIQQRLLPAGKERGAESPMPICISPVWKSAATCPTCTS